MMTSGWVRGRLSTSSPSWRGSAHILAPIVGELEEVNLALVTQLLNEVIAQAVVLVQLDHVGDDHNFVQNLARLKRQGVLQHFRVGEERFDIRENALVPAP
jgi:hypothetical protein